jgi:methionine-rich copper-binding protein CopC
MKNILCIIAFILILPSAVFSHVDLREKSPPEDAILETPPEKVVISFFGSIEPTFSKIEVFNLKGDKVSLKSHVSENGSVMEVSFSKKLIPGAYTVKWLCVSIDGHKVKGSYTFTVK